MVKYTIDQIINAGRSSYLKFGNEFTMKNVAKELGTGPSSLYRHVENKRELYYAMLTREFEEFNQWVSTQVQTMKNPSPLELMKMIGRKVLEISREDFERFSLMFLTKPPDVKSNNSEPGVFETACNPEAISFLLNLCKQLVGEQDYIFMGYTLVSAVIGASIVTSETFGYLQDGFLKAEDKEMFHEFVLERSITPFLSNM